MIFPTKHVPNNQFILIIRITTRHSKLRKIATCGKDFVPVARVFLIAVKTSQKWPIVKLPPTLYVAIPKGLALLPEAVSKGKPTLSRGILSSHPLSDSSSCALAYQSSIGSPCSKRVNLFTLIGIYIHTPTLVMHIQCAGSKFLEAICARKSDTRLQRLKGHFSYLRALINITCFAAKRKAH